MRLLDPEFLPESVTKTWPAWAQRRLVLGLDLQGGSQILLEVDLNDVRKQRLDNLRDEVRRTLRNSRISWTLRQSCAATASRYDCAKAAISRTR